MWRRPQTRLPRLGTRLPRLGPRLGAEFSSANQGRRWTYPTNGDTDAAGAAAAAGAADASHCCPRKMVLVGRTHASNTRCTTYEFVVFRTVAPMGSLRSRRGAYGSGSNHTRYATAAAGRWHCTGRAGRRSSTAAAAATT